MKNRNTVVCRQFEVVSSGCAGETPGGIDGSCGTFRLSRSVRLEAATSGGDCRVWTVGWPVVLRGIRLL
ncbi:hypothetical protein DPMN_097871 [Dreissena polymorpha]|uniref:Uncharacterized protein n=1 Tax=Dreissena polymorpha TaxID=45954 RepID=A0A9D4LB28_DREPO|nr:hypothetical protein DPMN_097871 [Dreissena polymorpha]